MRRSPRLTGKKRLNYAEQLSNLDNLQMLISLIRQDKAENKHKKKSQFEPEEEESEEEEEDEEMNEEDNQS